MTRPLIIVGAGGNAHDVLDIIDAINAESHDLEILGFLDDRLEPGADHLGYSVIGNLEQAGRYRDVWFVNAIGSDRSFMERGATIARTSVEFDRFVTLIHPTASISPRATIGIGVGVGAGAIVGGDARIQDHVWLGAGVIVGHETVVEELTVVAPGAVISGMVRIGRCSYIGAGATVRQRIRVGSGALVGMGAVVVADVPAGVTVVGNPARRLCK